MTIRNRPHGKPPPAAVNNVSDLTSWLRTFWDSYYPTRHGKLDCTTSVTLTANAATTTLNDYRLSPQSIVHFDPVTANAATEIYGATMYVLTANRGNKVWTITHANNAQADRTFGISILG